MQTILVKSFNINIQKGRKMEKEERTICDKCANYEVSPGGCCEKCWAKLLGSQVIASIDDDYIALRMGGMKNNCKCFVKI